MELNRIVWFVAVALVAAIAGGFVGQSLSRRATPVCDIHPVLSDRQLQAIKTNLARARAQGFESASGEGRDAANKAAEDLAFDTFVHNLRGPLEAEYVRHRAAMDGCF